MKTEQRQIVGYYIIENIAVYDSTYSVVKADDINVVLEIAKYLYGDNISYYLIFESASASIHTAIVMLDTFGIKQGYITKEGKIAEYKTRAQLINDILADL